MREDGRETRILFSGDVGRFDAVLDEGPRARARGRLPGGREHLRQPHAPATCPCSEQLEGVLKRTFARGGVLLIPAFAVGRAQQMIFLMDQLVTAGRMRPFPIHVDSPMAIDATRIYASYPDAHRVSLNGIGGRSLLYGKWVQLAPHARGVRGPQRAEGPGGDHLLERHARRAAASCTTAACGCPHAENTLLITGYQAAGTLGRALLDGARIVRIHKGEVPVLAEVADLKGMSGHADAARCCAGSRRPETRRRRVFLTHGEEGARARRWPTSPGTAGSTWGPYEGASASIETASSCRAIGAALVTALGRGRPFLTTPADAGAS